MPTTNWVLEASPSVPGQASFLSDACPSHPSRMDPSFIWFALNFLQLLTHHLSHRVTISVDGLFLIPDGELQARESYIINHDIPSTQQNASQIAGAQ